MDIANIPFDAYSGEEPYIFVSYAHKDAEKVYPLMEKLHNMGYRLWYDEGIDPGNEWVNEIAQALYKCSYFIVFISQNSVNSINVKKEAFTAVSSEKDFLAICIEDTDLPLDWKLHTSIYQAIMQHDMNDDDFKKLIARTLPDELKGSDQKYNNNTKSETLRIQNDSEDATPKRQVKRTKKKKQNKRRSKTIGLISIITAVVIAAGLVGYFFLLNPNIKYNHAVEKMNKGEYDTAISYFSDNLEYKDNQSLLTESQYQKAISHKNNGEYQSAIVLLTELDGYKDSEDLIIASKYEYANNMISGGEFDYGIQTFNEILEYKDSETLVLEAKYIQASNYRENNDFYMAIENYKELGSYKDSKAQIRQTEVEIYQYSLENDWQHLERATINDDLIVVKEDGTAIAFGSNDGGQCKVDDWTDVVAIAGGTRGPPDASFGIKSDGRVVASEWNRNGSTNVQSWTDIVSIASTDITTVGLKSDGMVVAVGDNTYGQCDVEDWSDIANVFADYNYTIGIKRDGTVIWTGGFEEEFNFDGWTDIVDIHIGKTLVVGIKKDGSVVYTGDNKYKINFESWENIVKVLNDNTGKIFFALKADGTTILEGSAPGWERVNCDDWVNIVDIKIADATILGLKEDGTAVASGNNYRNRCHVQDWTDLVAITFGLEGVYGIKNNGTIVATGADRGNIYAERATEIEGVKLPE